MANYIRLSLEQKQDLIQLVKSCSTRKEAYETFNKKYNLSLKEKALDAHYYKILSKDRVKDVIPNTNSKLPAGFTLMQAILNQEIQLSPSSKVIITPTELIVQF